MPRKQKAIPSPYVDTPLASGNYFISQLTFRVASLAIAGNYRLSITDGMLDDGGFGQTITDLTIALDITSVREPDTSWLLLAALLVLGWNGRKRTGLPGGRSCIITARNES